MKIIVDIEPFSLNQKFYVYADGQCIETKEAPLEDFNKTIFNLSDRYNVNQVDLVGPKSYLLGLKNGFEQEQVSNYSKNIKINII